MTSSKTYQRSAEQRANLTEQLRGDNINVFILPCHPKAHFSFITLYILDSYPRLFALPLSSYR